MRPRSQRASVARLLVVALLALTACARTPAALAPAHRIPVRDAAFTGVAWLPNGQLMVSLDPETGLGANQQIWRLNPDGSDYSQVVLPDDPAGSACNFTLYFNPVPLPDGRVGLQRVCYTDGPEILHLVALDPSTGTVGEISPALSSSPVSFYRQAWNPTLTEGVYSDNNDICSTLTWITDQAIEARTTTVTDGGHTFKLEGLLDDSGACGKIARASTPAWSPDGARSRSLRPHNPSGLMGSPEPMNRGTSTRWTPAACR